MIVFPMAGESQRFKSAGFDVPKFMLPLHGRAVFDYAVASFAKYFRAERFVFICRAGSGVPDFVMNAAKELGVQHYEVVALDSSTKGQAETVARGLSQLEFELCDQLVVFNIDTIRPGFELPELLVQRQCAGYIEVFVGEGEGWSFVRPEVDDPDMVLETAEKRRISELCSTGLYHFSRVQDFLSAVDFANRNGAPELFGPNAEMYVAPLYNYLIRQGLKIGIHKISPEQVIFCGVPTEYARLLSEPAFESRLRSMFDSL